MDVENFLKHEITGDLLLDLNYNSLRDIGVVIVGDRARILQAIKQQFAPATAKTPRLAFRPTGFIGNSGGR